MVVDQGQVVVVAAPGHLVHPDGDQPVQPVGVQLGGHDAFADAPDGVPVDAQEPGDRALVGPGGQVRGDVLQVAGEPGPVPGERYGLGHHPAGGAVQPAQLGPHEHHRGAEVQMPPRRSDRPGVVGRPAGAGAAPDPPAAGPARVAKRHTPGHRAGPTGGSVGWNRARPCRLPVASRLLVDLEASQDRPPCAPHTPPGASLICLPRNEPGRSHRLNPPTLMPGEPESRTRRSQRLGGRGAPADRWRP